MFSAQAANNAFVAKLGEVSYDEHAFGTAWWAERAADPDHQIAYATIVELLKPLFSNPPEKIVDYACGTGMLMAEMLRAWPTSQIYGIDESEQALEAVPGVFDLNDLAWPQKQVTLLQEALPGLQPGEPVERGDADLVFFVFPDFRCDDAKEIRKAWKAVDPDYVKANRAVRKTARDLTNEDLDSQTELFLKRLAGADAIRRAKTGGLIVRVEYAYGSRDECDDGHMALIDWWSGAVPADLGLGPWLPYTLADRLQSTFVPSKVINDVNAQHGWEEEDEGGFLVEVYRAR